MPTIAPGDKVLVSGASGYIAIWVVRTLLEQRYAVRGTVRSVEKGRHLTELFKDYGSKLELVVVEDVAKVRTVDRHPKYFFHEHYVPGRGLR
jgi:nucleoside-diphosphate-sugar epimerase